MSKLTKEKIEELKEYTQSQHEVDYSYMDWKDIARNKINILQETVEKLVELVEEMNKYIP